MPRPLRLSRRLAMSIRRPAAPRTRGPYQAGVTLIELVLAIVIIGVSLGGILGAIGFVTKNSADPLLRKQAIVLAESLLEEIETCDMIAAASNTAVTIANRLTSYHVVSDYNGFSTSSGVTAADGTAISGLASYNFKPAVSVSAISSGELGASVLTTQAVKITVSVTDPEGIVTTLTGYRTAY